MTNSLRGRREQGRHQGAVRGGYPTGQSPLQLDSLALLRAEEEEKQLRVLNRTQSVTAAPVGADF